MPTNFYMFFIAGIIPMIVGAAYYSPMLAGNSWMKVNGFNEKDLEGGNMLAIFGGAYFLSVIVSFALSGIVIHQTSTYQLGIPEVFEAGSQAQIQMVQFMKTFGNSHRNFGHGAAHGALITIFFILPILGIISLFERRGWKYVFIHFGYWLITLTLVGGLLCATLEYPPV